MILLFLHIWLGFYHVLVLLFYPDHKSFPTFYELTDHGYTESYIQHVAYKRQMRLKTLVSSVLLIGWVTVFEVSATILVPSIFGQSVGAVNTPVSWDNSGGDGLWSNCTNWVGDVCPGVGNIATFDPAVSDTPSTIDAGGTFGGSIAGVNILTGFTGTITQARSLTLASSGWTQAGGVFTGASQDITINSSGPFALSAGTFTSTSGNFQTTGNFTISGTGSFEPSTGTVTISSFSTNSATYDVVSSETFNNFIINSTNALVINTGDTLVVTGTLTLTRGFISSGTVDAKGNIIQAATFSSGSGIINFSDDDNGGDGDTDVQTYTIAGGSTPIINLDSAADANDIIIVNGATYFGGIITTADFTGTVPITNASDYILSFRNITLGGGTLSGAGQAQWILNACTFTQASSTVFIAPALITVSSASSMDVLSTQNVNNFTVLSSFSLGSGDTLIINGNLTLTTGGLVLGTFNVMGDITQGASFQGSNGIINFSDDTNGGDGDTDVQTYTIAGGSAPKINLDSAADANDIITVNGATVFYGLTTTTGFTGTVPITNTGNYTLSFRNLITLGGGTLSGAGQAQWIFINLTYTQSGSAVFIAPLLITTTGSVTNMDVISTQAVNNLTVNGNGGMYLSTGDTLIINGNLTLSTGYFESGTLNVMGDITQGSSFVGGHGTLNFSDDTNGGDGDTDVQTYTIAGGSVQKINLDSAADANDIITVNGTTVFSAITTTAGFTGTVPMTNTGNYTLTFQNLTLGGGTLSGAGQAQWIFNVCTYTQSGSAVFIAPLLITTTGSGHTTMDVIATQEVNNFTVATTGGYSTMLGNSDTLIINGTLILTGKINQGTFQPKGDVTIGASFDGSGTSTLVFAGSANQSFNLTGATGVFNKDITVNKTGGAVNLASALVMDAASQDLVIQQGTFDLSGNNLTVNGGSGTLVVQNTGTLRLQGGETITANASNPQLQSGSTVYYDGTTGPYTLKNYTTYQGLTIDGSGTTFNLPAALDVNGNLTISAGTLDTTASNFQTNVAGNWSNSGTFNGQLGLVVFDGTSQTISGTTTFNAFTKSVVAAATLTFPASVTQTFTGALILNGVAGQRLSLRSSVTDTKALIDPQSNRTVSYLDVKDNDNNNLTAITCGTGCLDSTNNENWIFPGVTITTPDAISTEAGGTAEFTAVLTTQPTSDVSFTVVSSDLTAGTIVPASLTFTNGNWSTPQTVTVTGVNDALDDGDIAYSIITGTTSSVDAEYVGKTVADVSLTNTDDDVSGVTVNTTDATSTEAGDTAAFTMVLTAQPTGDVEVDSVTTDATEGTVTTGAILTFTSVNWATPQTITVTGQNDAVDDGDIGYSITTTVNAGNTADALYDVVNPSDPALTNTDDDTAGFTISAISGNTTEAGGTATCTVKLTSEPTGDVTIPISSTDTTEGTITSAATLTFTALNWNTNQTVTVTGQNDAVDDGDILYAAVLGLTTSSDGNYSGVNPADVAVTNIDNDTAGVTVGAVLGDTTEVSDTATYSVVLNTQPTGDVEIDATSNDVTEGTVTNGATLIFTSVNWAAPQTVTITGVNDDVDDGNIGYLITTTVNAGNTLDSVYDVVDPVVVSVTNIDNDTAGITLTESGGSTDVEEEGATSDTYNVVLSSEPTSDVTIEIIPDSQIDIDASLTFTSGNWDVPQTVTVTAVDDAVDEVNIHPGVISHVVSSADINYNNFVLADVTANVTDNDNASFLISDISGDTTETGGMATYTIVLTSQPVGDVAVDSISSDATEGNITSGGTLTFTADNWSAPQTVTVTGANDDTVDGNIDYTIILSSITSTDPNYNNINPDIISVINLDQNSAGITITAPTGGSTLTEGGDSATYIVVLDSQPTGDVMVIITDGTEVSIDPTTLIFTPDNWSTPQTV
ncbi:MAG: hypothetical protein WCV88_05365, partial [Patescibacteria group bacterium]